MKYSDYKYLILSDLYRITGNVKLSALIQHVLFGDFLASSYNYIFWMRTCCYAKTNPFLKYTIYPIATIIRIHLKYKLGISIHSSTQIGSGFYIGHFGGIFVSQKSVIGKNCNISQGVVIGRANRGKNQGVPTLGDNAYVAPGVKIFGAVKIGNNVAIGANCVVTKDIPDNSVVVGIPGKVISQEGAIGYINRTDYEDKIR